MQAHHYTMLGLEFDIVGAFLVAVEAIKLENVRRLRDGFFKRLHRYTLSPRLAFRSADDPPAVVKADDEVPSERYVGLFIGLHYVAGLLVLIAVDAVAGGRLSRWLREALTWTMEQPWYVAIAVGLLALVFGIFLGLWGLGEIVHMGLGGALRGAVNLLDFIDVRTPDGTVGIAGFVLLAIGFGLQIYGAYLGAA